MDEAIAMENTDNSIGEVDNITENNEQHEEVIPQEPVVPTKRKVKYQIDGQEIEEELDDETLVKGYQYSKAAGKKFQEAAQMRKQAEMLVKVLQQDPAKVLKEVGMDPYQWAEQLLVARMEEERMDPKDRELAQYKKQLEAIEQEKKVQAEAQQKQVFDQLVTHYQQDFEKQIIDSLTVSGLPRTEHTVTRMAYYMGKALDAGYKDVTFADVVPLVKSDYENEVRSLFGSAPVEQLINLFGEEPIKKIRNYDLEKIKQNSTPQGGRSTPTQQTTPTAQSKKLTPDEWREEIRRRASEG